MTDVPTVRAGAREWMTLAVVSGGLFLAVLSTTVVSVALPKIGAGLHASATELQWIVDAYVLVYASLLAAGGVVGDRRGRKGVFVVGVGLFGLGSLVCGLAPTLPVLLAGRVLQGLGPALVVPGSLAIIRVTFEDERQRASAIGLWSTSSGLALAVGPALGGAVVTLLGWRWVFLFGAPLGVALMTVAAVFVPHVPPSRSRGGFDWLGAVLTTLGIAALAFAIIEGQTEGWTSPPIVAAFVATAAAFVVLAAWESRREEPLIDVSLFRAAPFAVANVAALIVFFAFVGAIVYFSAYFQQVQGRSPIEAGLDVSAIGVAFALAATASGRVVGRIGGRWPMIAGLLLAGAATIGLLRLAPGSRIAAIWWDFALLGAGVGLCLTPMTSIAVSAVGPARAGMASAIHNALRQVGQVLGVAVLGALVYARLPRTADSARLLSHPQGLGFVDGLHSAIWVSGLALFAAALAAAFVLSARDRNAHVHPRRSQMSTVEETNNKATFSRFHNAMNTGDPDVISNTIDELVEPDVLIRTPLPVKTTGAPALKEVFGRLHHAFPDLHVTVEDLIAEGDKVVGRNSVTGTHQSEYMGLPATGNTVTYNEIFIFRFAGGRIAETWGVVDVLSQMRQLGAIPPPS